VSILKAPTSQTTTGTEMRVGAYPGTFNPPTVAHLAIAEAARRQGGLDRIELVLSRFPLGKDPAVPSFEHRLQVLNAVAASRPWLAVTVTDKRLIADVAAGYDAVIMGSDKWIQVCDPAWYGGSPQVRDAALARLPQVWLVERPGYESVPLGPDRGRLLIVDQDHAEVSSSQVRAGRRDWMAPEAAAFDAATGAWSHPERYLAGPARAEWDPQP
jgi:nicotinic acid mononucleotide adenylyltransferase